MKKNKPFIGLGFLLAVIFVLTPLLTHGETLAQATLRSGTVIAEHSTPAVLEVGQVYDILWKTQSYVDITSQLVIKFPDGQVKKYDANLARKKEGVYSIQGNKSNNYTFSASFTVPQIIGDIEVGYYHAQNDRSDEHYNMYGLLASVQRPVGTASKQFYSNICESVDGGQCVSYIRDLFGGDYGQMPGLCAYGDCGAALAYDYWEFGHGKGYIPKIKSIMVLARSNILEYGHVGVVMSIKASNDGTFQLIVNESNWDSDEMISCGVPYTLDPDSLTVTRAGDSQSHPLKGFIYTQ